MHKKVYVTVFTHDVIKNEINMFPRVITNVLVRKMKTGFCFNKLKPS